MEKAFFPRQDRENGVISRLLPQLSSDTVDSYFDLLKISSVVDGTKIRGTGICHNHSYRWKMAIESAVKSIAVVPDRFFDIKGKSYRIDWDRKVSAASLPTYTNYKDAVIYKINNCSKAVVPPLAKIIFDYDMQDQYTIFTDTRGTELNPTTIRKNVDTITYAELLKAFGYTIYENGAVKRANVWYIPIEDLNKVVHGTAAYETQDEEQVLVGYNYTFLNQKFIKPNDPSELLNIISTNPVEVVNLDMLSSIVNYAQNATMTALFALQAASATGTQLKDTIGSVNEIEGTLDLSLARYLAIIVDNNNEYHALVGRYENAGSPGVNPEGADASGNITQVITWYNPATPVDVSQFKGIDMWLRFQSINEMIYFIITKYENDIIEIDPATINTHNTTWSVNTDWTSADKNEDIESNKAQGKLWAYINPRTMKPYEDDYWFHQGEPYYVKSLTLAPKGKILKGKKITVKADQWPGMYMFVGETYIRDKDTGEDERMQIKFPLCKVKSDHTLTLQADGDPTTFNLSLEVARPSSGVMMELTSYEVAEKLLEGDNGCFYAVDGSTEVLSE